MKKVIAMFLLAAAATPLIAQEKTAKPGDLTDPIEILKKADDATKALESVKYVAATEGVEANAPKMPKVEGTVVLSGWNNGAPQKWFYNITVQAPGSTEKKEVVAGTDGETYFVIDKQNKKVYADIDPAVLGSTGRMIRGITMLEYVHPTPFSDELNGEKQELVGSATIGNEECYEIFVKYKGPAQEAHWFFSKKDFLPRQAIRLFQNPAGERGGTKLTVTLLTPDPKLDEAAFKLVVPDGFEKIDDFAP
ncbi:MAG: hypothetical protein AABZ12_01250 [Planctomycetota bacterium]